MRGFSFNGKNIKDFDCYVKKSELDPPSKNEIRESVPFMNGSYDFSSIYGGQIFNDRKIVYYIDLIEDDSTSLNIIKTNLENWLLTVGEAELFDSSIEGYYFIAKCMTVEESDNEYSNYSELKITFTAYPFKIRNEYEGELIWDTFSFELDSLQDTLFMIDGSDKVTIYNQSATNIIPAIICSSNMEITKDNIIYNIPSGNSKSYQFEFKRGKNEMIITGRGQIEFKFKREVL